MPIRLTGIDAPGLDVHKDTIVAAVRLIEGDGVPVETVATTTPGLAALSDWLERHDCPTVAMEATGIYWRPVWGSRRRWQPLRESNPSFQIENLVS